MEHNKVLYLLTGILAVLLLGALIWWATAEDKYTGTTTVSETVPIQNEYPEKIVYTTDAEANTQALRADCNERGGTFNECGSICPATADICADVCAYTCELSDTAPANGSPSDDETQAGENAVSFAWTTHTDQDMGFSIEYPRSATIQPNGNGITFVYTGPTQREGTEVYDGISFTVSTVDMPNGTTLHERAQMLARGSAGLSTEIIDPVKETSVNQRTAYRWRAESLGTFTHYLIAATDRTAYHLYFTAPDPDNRGYAPAANRMLTSFTTL